MVWEGKDNWGGFGVLTGVNQGGGLGLGCGLFVIWAQRMD